MTSMFNGGLPLPRVAVSLGSIGKPFCSVSTHFILSFCSVISEDGSCRITNMNKLRTDLMSGFIQGLDNDVDLYSRTTDHSGLDSQKFI